LTHLIFAGILIVLVGVLLMLAMVFMHFCPILSLFLPATIIYFGLCFIFSNASSLAMSRATDKAHGSAVMSFVNMGLATIMVLNLGYVPVNTFVLPVAYFALCVVMVLAYGRVLKKNRLEAKKI
jgi:hypothetical protein